MHQTSPKLSALGSITLCAGMWLWVNNVQAQSLRELVEHAWLNHPTVLAAQSRTQASEADIQRATSAHYPQIDYSLTRSNQANNNLPLGVEQTGRVPTARLNLWSGGRIQADVNRSRHLTQAAQWQQRQLQEDVTLQVVEAFIRWYSASELHVLALKNLDAHRLTMNDIAKIAAIDTGRRIDLEQARIRHDNAEFALLQRELDLDQAKQQLSRFWPRELAPLNTQIFEKSLEALGAYPLSLNEVLTAISDELPAVAQQQAQVLASQAGIDMAKSQFWPSLDVVSSRQPNPNSPVYAQETLTQVRLSMPLFSGGSSQAGLNTAVHQYASAKHLLEEARVSAKEKAVLTWQELKSLQDRSQRAQTQVTAGHKLLEGYRQQFRLGRRQLLDLLNAQNEVFNYQTQATRTRFDEYVLRARLLASLGHLTQRFKL